MRSLICVLFTTLSLTAVHAGTIAPIDTIQSVPSCMPISVGPRASGSAPWTGVHANRAVALRASARETGVVVANMAADQVGTVQACDAKWVRVQHGTSDGWMAPGAHCGNAVTGCV